MLPSEIQQILESRTGKIKDFRPVAGGSINQCFRLSAGSETYFLKINDASEFPQLFKKERAGLETLRRNGGRTPDVICDFIEDDVQVLLLSWIDSGKPTRSFWQKAGEILAALHLCSYSSFGFSEDNYMGSVPQANDFTDNWVAFFIRHRLLPLVRKCELKGYLDQKHFTKFDRLFSRLPGLFPPSSPCLLHGDLWNGNLMCNENSEPVFIDPAVYYGHRSIDIGMTMLFGGFDKAFSDAYLSNAKPDDNFSEQCEISNLYPLLIHLYLFGSSYQPPIESILNKYTG